jgi:hypothetical protein
MQDPPHHRHKHALCRLPSPIMLQMFNTGISQPAWTYRFRYILCQ